MKLETENKSINSLLTYKYILCENKSTNPEKPFNYMLYGGSNNTDEVNDRLKHDVKYSSIYEYIRENSKVKPYIDFDIKDEHRFKYESEDDLKKIINLKNTILKKLINIFKSTLYKLGCDVNYNNILILDGSRTYKKDLNQFFKVSFHLTINLNYVFENQSTAKHILLKTFKNVELELTNNTYLFKHVDDAVYGKTQRMRTINSNKHLYDKEKLKPINKEGEIIKVNNYIDYLITYFNDDYIILNADIEDDLYIKNEKVKKTTTANKNILFNKYNNDIQKLLINKGMKTATINGLINNTFYKVLYNHNVDGCVYGNRKHDRVINNNAICYAYVKNGIVYGGCWGAECKKNKKINLGCILERSPLEEKEKAEQVSAPLLGLNDEVKKIYNRFINDDDLRALCIKSAYGTGKTYILNEYVNKYIFKFEQATKREARVLVISTRQSYARAMCVHSMKDLKINNYLDYTKEEKEKINNVNRLCLSLEGLFNMMFEKWKPYDVIILDESESITRHLFSCTIKQGAYATYERLKLLLSRSKKLFIMDADLGTASLQLTGQYEHNKILCINNQYTKTKREYITTYDKEDFINDIKANMFNNQNVYIVCLSATDAMNINNILTHTADILKKKIKLFYGDAGDNIKQELKEVNHSWSNANVIITTSTTGAGIDYNIKDHIYKIYGYISAGSACPSEFLQILNRVRAPINNNITLLLDSKLKLPYNILDLNDRSHSNIYTVNNAKYRLDELNKHIINDEVYFTYEDEEGYINNERQYKERDPCFTTLTYYNYLTTALNNNSNIYTLILKLLIEQQGNKIHFDPVKMKQPKTENQKIKQLQNTETQHICRNDTDIIKMKQEKTEKEKLILKKKRFEYDLKINKDHADGDEIKQIIKLVYKNNKSTIISNLKECYIKSEFKDTLRTDKEYTDETQRTKDLKLSVFRKVLKLINYDYTHTYIITPEQMKEYEDALNITPQEKNIISRYKLGNYEYIRAALNKYGFNIKKDLERCIVNKVKITKGVKKYIVCPCPDIYNVLNLIVNNNVQYEENIKMLCNNYNKYIHIQSRKRLIE